MNDILHALKAMFAFVWVLPLLMLGWAIGLTIVPIIAGIMMIKDHFYNGKWMEEDED